MSRRSPKLVTQYLERVDRRALEEHPELIRKFVGRRTGIYALFRRDELYYAGLATDLRWRLKHHVKDRHRDSWDTFSVYLTIGDQHLRELESLLIRVTRPPGNKQMGRFSGAENIRKKLERDLKEKHRRSIDALLGRPTDDREDDDKPGRSIHIRGRYKGKLHHAWLRHVGTVKYKGKVYTSLSAAATAVTKSPTNGRWFWQFKRGPGDWARVREMR
jgi:hypothetical protein